MTNGVVILESLIHIGIEVAATIVERSASTKIAREIILV